MPDETLQEIAEKDYDIEVKLIVSCTSGSKIKLLLSKNIKGELDFIIKYFTVARTKKIEPEIKNKITQILNTEYLNDKKNQIEKMDLIRRNKGDLKKFIMDCFITVSNDKTKPGRTEEFLSTDEITKTSARKSLAVINTLVYFTDNKKI